jgi:hypothetical protein
MQNRYVGDVGDFAKYSLLRSLSRGLRLGILWYLFEDEIHNSDGRHTSYLSRGDYRSLDEELHDALAAIIRSGARCVGKVASARLFPPETIFFDAPISISNNGAQLTKRSRHAFRTEWLSRALASTADCDLVFFDPDNGVEVSSVSRDQPKAGKYVFLEELQAFWKRGQSLVVYQHLNRTAPIERQSRLLKKRFMMQFPDAGLVTSLLFRRGSCRHFWLLAKPGHRAELQERIEEMLNSGWGAHFELD